MKRITIVLLAVFFFLSISGLILIQVSWIRKAVAITDQQFRYMANKVLESVVLELEEDVLQNTPDIRDRIDPDDLNKKLRAALDNVEIYLDFEFSIHSRRLGTIWKTPGFNDRPGTNKFIIQLFPNDPVPSQNQIVLYFLQEKQYKFTQIGSLGIFSILFSCLLIVLSTGTFIVIFRQKKISDIRNDFINNMTHELKTPISTISLASQMLSDKSIPENEKNTEALSEIISDESLKLERLVENVLQMALFERTSMEFEMIDLNIHDLLDKTINNFELKIKSRQVGRITKNFKAVNAMISANETHIGNAMSNLIDNAVKYSK